MLSLPWYKKPDVPLCLHRTHQVPPKWIFLTFHRADKETSLFDGKAGYRKREHNLLHQKDLLPANIFRQFTTVCDNTVGILR